MDLQIGSTVGDYQIVGILGAGGMGKVYKVRNVISDRNEAMKVLLPDLANEPELADRFLREIKVQASLEHPNIAALHTAVRVDNQLLMVMELVEGVTLEQALKDGPLPVDRAVDYTGQVLSALDYAHARGVIHRDIKPANMMLTPGGVVKLMDFGIAKAATDRRLTMTGTTMGSLYYMSPEQIQGSPNIDARSDLYSVGVSLYELVTGKRPFDGDSQFAIMSAHLEKTPAPPTAIDPRLPAALNDIILLSVAKDPNARFQTGAAFRNALSSIFAAPAPEPAPVTVTAPAPSAGARSRRGLWMAIGALAAAAVVIGAIEFAPRKGTKAAQPPASRTVPASGQAAAAPQPVTPSAGASNAPAAAESSQPATLLKAGITAPSAPAVMPPAQAVRRPAVLPSRAAASLSGVASSVSAAPSPNPALLPVQPIDAGRARPDASPQPPPQFSQPQLAEMRAARERMAQLNARALGIRDSVQSLRNQQVASGLGLSSKFTEPLSLMNSFMQGAHDALNANDLASAKDLMDKAERQIEILEKLTNR